MGNIFGKFIGKLASGESVYKTFGEKLSNVYNEQVTRFLIKSADGSVRSINRTVVSKSDLVSKMAKRSTVPRSSWDKTQTDLGSRVITEFYPRSIVSNRYSVDGKHVREHVLGLSKDGKMLDFQSLRTPNVRKNVIYNGKNAGVYEANQIGLPLRHVNGVSPKQWVSAVDYSGNRFKI